MTEKLSSKLFGRHFMPPKSSVTHRVSYSFKPRPLSTTGISTTETQPCFGGEVASSVLNSSIGSKKHSKLTPTSKIYCLRRFSKRPLRTPKSHGVPLSQPLPYSESPFQPSALLCATTMATDSLACRPTCCRLNVITLAHIRTVESTKKALSTASGCNFAKNHQIAELIT